jgi:signal transduction histidine kinase
VTPSRRRGWWATEAQFPYILIRFTIRSALFVGFGLTLGLWLAVGYYFTQRLADLENRSVVMSNRYLRAQELLTTARVRLLRGSVSVRDSLLDPDPASVEEYRIQMDNAFAAAESALQEYVPVLDSESERERAVRLRTEINDLRNTMLDVLATDAARPLAEAGELLRTLVVRRREAAVSIADEMQELNRTAFVQHQAEAAALYRSIQARIWEILGLALLASVGIAVLATTYAGRLESDLRLEQAKDAQNTRDLQRLSAKLTTAQEEERRTIARELHDEVGQQLTAIKVELAIAQRLIEADGGSVEALQGARSIADGALQVVRDLSRLLHPALLDDLGLPAAIDFHLKAFGKRHDLHVELIQNRMLERLPFETEVAAYRIVQEALTNVAKHARASECRVHLERLPASVRIAIEDNGTGFELREEHQARGQSGLGLIGIRERVSQLMGTIHLTSSPGHGTKLTIELPAPGPAASTDTFTTPALGTASVNGAILHG